MQRPLALMLGASIVSLNLIGGHVTSVSAQQQDPKSLWADFNHYVLIARPDLAYAAGQTLLEQVDDATLLKIIEKGDYSKNFEQTLLRAARVAETKDVAQQLDSRIQNARIALSRDAARIAQDIELLPKGQRAFRNAVQRLTSAGQFAAPQLIEVLRDDTKKKLQPYVLEAMEAIGQPMVSPLAAALPELEPVPQGQVAQVLAQIGYPQAMPFMKEVLENKGTDTTSRRIVEIAFNKLAASSGVSPSLDAASLYYILGKQQFDHKTNGEVALGFDTATGEGILWSYSDKLGLLYTPVPGILYGDILAMKYAKHSLELDSSIDASLSLYLMANMRRKNSITEGMIDPSYGKDMQPASFYGMLAGPDRMHDVLAQSLANKDSALALDAIDILAKTAGNDALISRGKAVQPLLEALSYPDARVRFAAAKALANAHPEKAFTASFRVVPVLAEAIRPVGEKTALVIAKDQESLNALTSSLSDLGYEAFGALSLADAQAEINVTPAVDLLVTNVDFPSAQALVKATENNYKLGAVPVIVQAPMGSQTPVSNWAAENTRVFATVVSNKTEDIKASVESASAAFTGQAVSDEEAIENAMDAMAILYDMALGGQKVYNIDDAQPALIQALSDENEEIVKEAGNILALRSNAEAQQALADAALAATGESQLALLDSLSTSATYFGNNLSDAQIYKIMKLVAETDGELAIAAAKTHGALALPTTKAVKEILK